MMNHGGQFTYINVQDTPLFDGKNPWFPVNFPNNQPNEMNPAKQMFPLCQNSGIFLGLSVVVTIGLLLVLETW